MRLLDRPLVGTLAVGVLSGLSFIPLNNLLSAFMAWPAGFGLIVWINVGLLALLLCRWSRTGPGAALYPWLLLLVALPGARPETIITLAAGVIAWIRSGVCFRGSFFPAFGMELLIFSAIQVLIRFQAPASDLNLALSAWLFFLLQASYFVFFPADDQESDQDRVDPFEAARRRADEVLQAGPDS